MPVPLEDHSMEVPSLAFIPLASTVGHFREVTGGCGHRWTVIWPTMTKKNVVILSLLTFWKETQLNKFAEIHSLASAYNKYQYKKLRGIKIDKLLLLGLLVYISEWWLTDHYGGKQLPIDCPAVDFEGRGKWGRILMYVANSYMHISMSGAFNRPILSTLRS